VQTHTLELNKRLDESDEELLAFAIGEIFELFGSEMKEAIVPFSPGIEFPGVEFFVPQRGDKKSLLELSLRNAKYFRQDKLRIQEKINPERHTQRILEQMKTDLRMRELPVHIECFDNSNIQGAHPVSAMVVFKNTKPSKKDYRHFNIRTVEGPNDFASMEEVITRRYRRMIEENQPMPQLIIIDGGKGQLSSAVESLERLGLRGKITVIGIAKKLEEIYFPGDSLPLYIDKKSETLRVIQQARNEAHRFGITHHRNRRSKATVRTELTEIQGISHITAQKLLKAFGSVKKLKEASEEEISKVIGKAKAKLVAEHFKS
jgi:excinuclease ABC subunit C